MAKVFLVSACINFGISFLLLIMAMDPYFTDVLALDKNPSDYKAFKVAAIMYVLTSLSFLFGVLYDFPCGLVVFLLFEGCFFSPLHLTLLAKTTVFWMFVLGWIICFAKILIYTCAVVKLI
jgi:hypothetical protein